MTTKLIIKRDRSTREGRKCKEEEEAAKELFR